MFSDKHHLKNISYIRASEAHIRSCLEAARHDVQDLFFTFSTFAENDNPQRNIQTLQNIFAWSIDIDYQDETKRPEDIYQYIMDEVTLPAPNYIEYGHRLRMIYLFSEPLRLIPGRKSTLLKGFSFMQKCMAKKINDCLPEMNAEANSAVSFFRMPGSINTKTGDVIRIEHISDETWTMQEIFDEWIPQSMIDASGNREKWIQSWKQKKESSKKSSWTYGKLWDRRYQLFLDLRTLPNIPREKLTFLFGLACLQTGRADTPEEVISLAYKFNEGFPNPLPEKEIKSKLRSIHPYKLKDQSIADMLHIDLSLLQSKTRKERDKSRYQQKRQAQINSFATKTQQIQERRIKIAEYIKDHYSASQIATLVNCSLATVKRDITYIKDHWDYYFIDETNDEQKITPIYYTQQVINDSTVQDLINTLESQPKYYFKNSTLYSIVQVPTYYFFTENLTEYDFINLDHTFINNIEYDFTNNIKCDFMENIINIFEETPSLILQRPCFNVPGQNQWIETSAKSMSHKLLENIIIRPGKNQVDYAFTSCIKIDTYIQVKKNEPPLQSEIASINALPHCCGNVHIA